MVARPLSTHCSTCGKKFLAPRTWRYCSKRCQFGRLGWRSRRRARELATDSPQSRIEHAAELLRTITERLLATAERMRVHRRRRDNESAVEEQWNTIESLELAKQLEGARQWERRAILERLDELAPDRDLIDPLIALVREELLHIAKRSPSQVAPALERLIVVASNRLELITRPKDESPAEAKP